MTKQKSTKRALLLSALSLLMCVSMLIGSTFAWFTDSVTSAGNKIQAGTLKIDLELLDKEDGWESIKESQAPIFNYDLWEPGYTDVKILKVENEGTLALKWYAKFVSENELTILANVIDVYVKPSATELTYPADRNLDGYTKVGTVAEFVNTIETTTYGNLMPIDQEGSVAYLGIALKMQETAGNEYQGLPLGVFDIQILATQLAYESDSFDDQYDAGLETIDANGVSRDLPDGSAAFYYNEDSGFYGRVRLTDLPENIGSEYVVPAEINDLGGALVGADLDKLTLPAGLQYAYKSLEGADIDEVVIEKGATVIPNRTFYKANIGSVVIPDSVTVIEQNAFAMAGAESIVVPASVTTVGEAAFQHMPNLETVTFEGNTAIEGYAFRGCAALRTVYLKGDDVTFVISETGKNSCWFCNGESNNPNTSNITFYVENEVVAARVKTAMGAEANNTKIYVDGKITVKVNSSEEFLNFLATAEAGTTIDATGVTLAPTDNIATTIVIPAGISVKGATFAPNGACWLRIGGDEQPVVFEDCSFIGLPLDQFKIASEGCNDITYANCSFTGMIMINSFDNRDAVNTFNSCTFGLANGFIKCGYVNCMAAKSIFNQCTFNYAGGSTMGSNQYLQWNAVNAYSENTNTLESNNYTTYVELNGCVRNGCGTYKNTANSTLAVK